MKEPKMKFKIFAAKEKMYDQWKTNGEGEDYGGCITKACWYEVEEKPTLKGAIGWRNKKQGFEGQYVIVPCY